MSELPASWAMVSLGEIGTVGSSRRVRQEDWQKAGVPFYRAREIAVLSREGAVENELFISRELFKRLSTESQIPEAGDLMITGVGTIGVPYVVKQADEFYFKDASVLIFKNRHGIVPEYLYYYFTSEGCRRQIHAGSKGTTVDTFTIIRANELPIPLPPLAEQKRIVAKIEELFSELEAGEERLRVARRQLGVYRQSLLKQAFEGHLTAKWRTQNSDKLESPATLLARIHSARQSRYDQQAGDRDPKGKMERGLKQGKSRAPQPISPLDEEVLSSLNDLPRGWTWAKMEQTCDVVRGGSPRPAGDPQYYDGDIPFLKVADLTRVEGPYVDNYTSTIKPAGLQKTRYVEPPVLLISNSGATLGVPRICRIAATFNDGVAAFLDLDPKTHRYFYYFWTSKTEALRNIDQGAAQPNLNTDLLKTYPVPLCSVPEQQEIVRLLDEQFEVIQRNEREIDGALRKSEALRQAILQKAFTGRLVPQAPSDEPATALLARLRAERAMSKPSTRSTTSVNTGTSTNTSSSKRASGT